MKDGNWYTEPYKSGDALNFTNETEKQRRAVAAILDFDGWFENMSRWQVLAIRDDMVNAFTQKGRDILPAPSQPVKVAEEPCKNLTHTWCPPVCFDCGKPTPEYRRPPAEKPCGNRWCGTCARVRTPDQVRSAPHQYECLKCGELTSEPPPTEKLTGTGEERP